MVPVYNEEPKSAHICVVDGVLRLNHSLGGIAWEQKEKALQAFYHGLRGTWTKWVKQEDRILHWISGGIEDGCGKSRGRNEKMQKSRWHDSGQPSLAVELPLVLLGLSYGTKGQFHRLSSDAKSCERSVHVHHHHRKTLR